MHNNSTVVDACVGLAAIAAQIPGLDQFRWPGYWLIFHSAVVAILMLLLFREKKSDLTRGSFFSSTKNLPVPVYVSFIVLNTDV